MPPNLPAAATTSDGGYWESAQPKLSAQCRLRAACQKGDGELLTQAIAAGADIESIVHLRSKATPLMLSASLGHERCVQALIEAGVKIEARNAKGETAAMLAASGGREKCLALLLAAGASALAMDRQGDNCAIRAARAGSRLCLRALAGAGANMAQPNRSSHPWSTPARAAVEGGHADCLAELISAGVDMDAPLGHGYTVAMFAASHGSQACVMLLIEAGADFEPVNKIGQTASMIARGHGHHALADFMDVARLAADERSALRLCAPEAKGSAKKTLRV